MRYFTVVMLQHIVGWCGSWIGRAVGGRGVDIRYNLSIINKAARYLWVKPWRNVRKVTGMDNRGTED